VVALTEQGVEHAGIAVRAEQPTKHSLGGGCPVDCPVLLSHGRLEPPPQIGTPVERFGDIASTGEAGQRLTDGLDRGVGHLVAIQGALGRKAHRELAISPDVASIELGSGLEHRNAPAPLTS
jgi:hypothetical protein